MNDKKRDDTNIRKNGVYIHYNTPKVIGAISSTQLRQWALSGPESKLERAILAGQGRRLLEDTDALPLSKYHINLIAKCDAIHSAVEKGSLLELQEQLEGEYNCHKYVKCYDEAGVGLLHKAVFYNYMDITEWLVNNFPQLIHQRDSEGRTPLHYSASSGWEAATLLERAGAVRGARDDAGHTLAYYRTCRTLLALPDMPARPNPPGLVIKRHNIRIWCHECDMGRLQRVVWEGQGARLLSEVSSQPIVKKFLEAVPYIMNTIRDVHTAVVQNDLEGLIKLTSDPVPPHALSCRDINNLTPMHKAAGLGHGSILKYIIERYPQGINDVDNDGRTPLHYAALVKDEQHTYNTLLSFGADESAVDNKNKTPGYYINKGQDIDKSIFKTLPDAPRTPSSSYPSSWDWKILETDYTPDINKKNKKKNHRTSNENISSKNNTNTISESIEETNGVMKNSSTQELISNFPELNDNEKSDPDNSKAEEERTLSKEEPNVEETNEKLEESDDNNKTIQERENTPLIETEDSQELDSPNNDEDNGENEKNINEPDTIEVKEEADNDLTNDNSEQNIENDTPNVESNDKTTEELKDIEHVDDDNLNNSTEENAEHYENIKEEDDKDTNTDDIHDIAEKENNGDEIAPENNETHDSLEIITKENGSRNHSPENTSENDDQEHNTDEDNEKGNEVTNDITHEDSKTSEGNTCRDNSEDDDDVQVQGSYHPEHNDIHTKSPTFKQNNGSAIRDNSRVSSGNPVNGRNIQESLIEGLISSEAEQETEDASITQREGRVHNDILIVDNEIDPEVSELINTANMEMLATLVLNGEGSRLIGRHSGNLELQAFLDNVPTYMQKINRVHIAAREGNIRELQAALDRRKFAIARDPISPNGATPLHVSVVFGKTTIIKYLGGRFPETLSAVDFEGRTALHYAAALPDNGHYYNLLQQLGSNSKDLDDSGRSAEDYYKNPTLLTFKQLHADFGVSEEEAQTMFSDKGISHAANGHLDIPIFQTEEGRYLAKSLGDPLIKGLTEVANIKPKDPIAFLATYLQNFPEHEKPRPGTQESNVLMTKEAAEFENEYPPYTADIEDLEEERMALKEQPRNTRTATKPRPIDVITVEPQTETSPDAPEIATSSADRDEHGQSMLHFAAARTHTNNALFQLLQESDVSLGYRDELYRTARDVSIQANVLENTAEIDRWVLHLAARGKTDKIMELLLQGYDHILDIVDEEGVPILEVVGQRGNDDMNNLLASIPAFEESRESLHAAARRGDLNAVSDVITGERGRTLARAHNALGRTALHVAVLAQHEEVVSYFAETCPELLRVGDNLERTPLHYAMGVEKMESLSRILIKAGAKRVLKDLKGRQPSYYFMNKSDILRLKEEEVAY